MNASEPNLEPTLSSKSDIKNRIRSKTTDLYNALTDEQYEALCTRICTRLMADPQIKAATTIHAYWPVLTRREPDIRAALTSLFSSGTRIILPVVESFSRKRSELPRMRHELFTDTSALVANRWGIFEPNGGELVDPSEIDLIIVPARAIDERGSRLGNGFGYYDEFLKSTNAVTICPIFDFARLKHIPQEPHDVQIAYTLTEIATWDNAET